MKLLHTEYHLFSKDNIPTISDAEALKFFESFKDLQLFPQKYQDVSPNGDEHQYFMFINGITGLTFRLRHQG